VPGITEAARLPLFPFPEVICSGAAELGMRGFMRPGDFEMNLPRQSWDEGRHAGVYERFLAHLGVEPAESAACSPSHA
jgi:hypothetical protein